MAAEKVEEGKNYAIYREGDQELIMLKNIRLSFPHFGTKSQSDNDDGTTSESWNGVAMLPKKTHDAAKIAFVKVMNKVIEGKKDDKGNPVKVESANKCIKNGDEKEQAEYADHWIISFSDSNRRPAIRDKAGNIIFEVEKIDNAFYGGCWANVMLRPWYFNGKSKRKPDKTYPKRICCGFTGAQFVRDDTPFGAGRIDDSNAWGAVEDDGDDGLGGSQSISSDDDF